VRFDELWTDDPTIDPKPTGDDLPMCPDGEHAGEITKAKRKDLKFMVKPDNPRGTSLVLEVEVSNYRPVEAIVPAQMRWLIESVCRAASVNIPVRGEEWDEEQLVGRQVRIDTVYGLAKSGREYVRVEKWLKGPDPLPEPKPAAIKATPKRTPAAKVEAAGQGGEPDDIPF
jgi:hypothetical protein